MRYYCESLELLYLHTFILVSAPVQLLLKVSQYTQIKTVTILPNLPQVNIHNSCSF